VTRLFLHQIYLNRELAALFVELSREVAQVAGRLEIPLVDFRGLAVNAVCNLPFDDAVESVIQRGRAMVERGMTQIKVSMLQDLERGKRTEADQVIGHVVRLAAGLGVAVPRVELLYRILRGTETARQSPPPPASSSGGPAMSFSIRPYAPPDLTAALGVVNSAAASYRSFLPPEEYHEPLMTREEFQREAGRMQLYVAEDACGEIVGVMGLEHVGEAALIRHGYVRPDHQRRGIGEALLAHLEGMAGPGRRIIIGTYRGNVAAQAHLAKHGYRGVEDSDAVLRTYYDIPEAQRQGSIAFEKCVGEG
jgi:GNAT superfamily N-acetyltransferase